MINLHNHSSWSDGNFMPEQLAELGYQYGLSHIGISDHFFTTKLAIEHYYVDINQLDAYIHSIRQTSEQYKDKIQVLTGLEIDWSPRSHAQIAALWPQLERLDYVLFEYVDDKEWLGNSLDTLVAVRDGIPIPVGLAHNNLSRNFSGRYTAKELATILERSDIFVELSTNPITAYYAQHDHYTKQLWEAFAEYDVWFSIGSDTHGFATDVGQISSAHIFLDEHRLSQQLITTKWDSRRRTWKKRTKGYTLE